MRYPARKVSQRRWSNSISSGISVTSKEHSAQREFVFLAIDQEEHAYSAVFNRSDPLSGPPAYRWAFEL